MNRPDFRLSPIGRAALGAALAAATFAAAAQTPPPARSFVLEGAVIDSRSAANLGVTSERGDIASLFRSQKALTFGILRAAGISLDSLPPDVRARIERFQTTNLDAFRAFSSGLDLKDQGRFAEARVQFQRAAELDPNFGLAVEQQQAMPDVTLGASVQIRAVVAAAAGQAVDRGKATYTLDAARATAAIQAGQNVVQVASTGPTDATALSGDRSSEYSTNPAGSGVQYVPNLVAGLAFSSSQAGLPTIGLGLTGEWKGDQYTITNGELQSVGVVGELLAQRQAATQAPVSSTDLADGSKVYWGRWLSDPAASASVVLGSTTLTSPALGAVDWIAGDATRQMPGAGTAVFSPAGGGNLSAVTGTIAVDFGTRGVALQGLGFSVDGLVFSGLNGSTTYDAASLSGGFLGRYSSGSCNGCTAFSAEGSSFGGNFVGKDANGLVFSTILQTGNGTSGGVTLLKRPGP